MPAIDYDREDPEQRWIWPAGRDACNAPSSTGSRRYLSWWKDDGAGELANVRHLPANGRQRRTARAGPTSTTSRCPTTAGASSSPHGRRARQIGFGEHRGEPVWQELPGEHRANLRRIIVTQGDTEPASVEQQRHLGLTAPSLYDIRNLFQVNVEEGRHLWAMVYLLHKFFGRTGARRRKRSSSGDPGTRTTPAFSGPSTNRRRLAQLLHVHVLHGPRRQVSALRPGRERLRSARPNHASSC